MRIEVSALLLLAFFLSLRAMAPDVAIIGNDSEWIFGPQEVTKPSPRPQKFAICFVDEIPTSVKKGPAAPKLSSSLFKSSGTPCAMPPIENASISLSPSRSFQTLCVCAPINSSYEGVGESECTFVHC